MTKVNFVFELSARDLADAYRNSISGSWDSFLADMVKYMDSELLLEELNDRGLKVVRTLSENERSDLKALIEANEKEADTICLDLHDGGIYISFSNREEYKILHTYFECEKEKRERVNCDLDEETNKMIKEWYESL